MVLTENLWIQCKTGKQKVYNIRLSFSFYKQKKLVNGFIFISPDD